ncbi:hypothetical protein BH20ACT23_BH20ACT23_28680 [soil metagenome]
MKQSLETMHARLSSGVESLVSSEQWAAMLRVAARFHHYSFNNQLLIYAQRPDATRVAGYRAWQRLGRQVRRRESGIAILAPCVYRTKVKDDEGEGELNSLAGFRVTTSVSRRPQLVPVARTESGASAWVDNPMVST